MTKYEIPGWFPKHVTQVRYTKWLGRKAASHLRRDKRRAGNTSTVADYKAAIHAAVVASNGLDAYTGEQLDWSLLSKYDNAESQSHGRAYKKRFALLPTVDHVGDGTGTADFRVCSWRVNDAKNDLSQDEFVGLCRRVVAFADGGSAAGTEGRRRGRGRRSQ